MLYPSEQITIDTDIEQRTEKAIDGLHRMNILVNNADLRSSGLLFTPA